jgi:DnaJ-class molecular chaperone
MKTELAYKLLGIDTSANFEQAQKAYRKLAQQYHPDKQGGNEEKFKLIKEAFETLSPLTKTKTEVITITLEEAFSGCIKELDGRVFVIRPGVYPGDVLENDVVIEITSESWSPRWGDDYPKGDVMKDFKLSPFKMILGGWVDVPILGGTKKAYIHPGFRANSILKLAQGGYWKNTEDPERGDCYLRLVPDIKQLHEYDKEELNVVAKYTDSCI